ncbi:MAG: DUF4185 domain-containing protein, partial [Chloroflexi bacterium]|nr:DUF4185 domain-containing protein [Chloroflexota bacterium]
DSPVIADIAWDWDSYVQAAPGSDLWPTTWAADGNIYSSWGDGGGFGGSNSDGRVPLGFARIEGPPENYVGVNVWGGKNPEYDNQATFGGKATGMISVDGALYAWINIENDDPPDFQLAWSSDLGATWQMETWNFPGGSGNFFPNTFLNFGQDNAGARDDFVYFYGRIWDDVNNVYLGRAPKGSIGDRAAYKFFRGLNANDDPIWSADVTKCQPVFTDPTNGRPAASVSFNPGLNRYIMTVPHGGVGKLGVF